MTQGKTQAKQRTSQTTAIKVVNKERGTTAADCSSPLTSVEGARFDVLWLQFEQEAGLSSEQLQVEREILQRELVQLEEKVAEKKEQIERVDDRMKAAKLQMRLLFEAQLSDEAILTAMRVQYQLRKPARKKTKSEDVTVQDEDMKFVIDHLDNEGLTLADLRQITNKDTAFLRRILDLLVKQGKALKSGERALAKYHLV